MTDDITTLAPTGALVADKLEKLLDTSRKQFNLPPYVNPTEYQAWKQEKHDIIHQQKTLHEQYVTIDRTYTGRDRYLERLSTYSAPFISNTTPVTADQCAMHGWIDTKERHMIANTQVYRLRCQQCSAILDIPCLTGANPGFESVKRIYSLYPTFLNRNHSDVCFWHTTSCHISVCAFPMVTTTEAFNLLETQGKLFQQWGAQLPVINAFFDKSKTRILHRIVKAIEGIDVFSFPQQQLTAIHETAYLLPMFGWHCLDEHNYRLMKCTCCFRHVSVPNYLQMNDLPTTDTNKSTLSPSPTCARSECINGAFDPLNEHRSYCPWRNRDIARMTMKDSFFIPPKQPLNGCEWMLEMVCKEWFRLTDQDEKHPRHDEFRRNAERYMSASIAKNRWMTGDLNKYALSKSLKRNLSDVSDVIATSDQQDKRQHTLDADEEMNHDMRTEYTKDVSTDGASLSVMNENNLNRESNNGTHTPTQTTSPVNTTPRESPVLQHTEDTIVAENKTLVDKLSKSPPHQQLDLLEPPSSMPTPIESQSNQLDTNIMAIPESSEMEMDSVMEITATRNETGSDQADTIGRDIIEDNLGSSSITKNSVDGSITAISISKDVTSTENEAITLAAGAKHSLIELPTATDTKAPHVIISTTDAATDVEKDEQVNAPVGDDTEATLDNELGDDESKEIMQVKEDSLVTPGGDDISTPNSWGLADTDSATNDLEKDESKTEMIELAEDEAENVDDYASAMETLPANKNRYSLDTAQDEDEDYQLSAATNGDEANMDESNNDLDLYNQKVISPMESEINSVEEQDNDTRQHTTRIDAAITIEQGKLVSELEPNEKQVDFGAAETDKPGSDTLQQMDMNQTEGEQQAKDTMELELDDLDTVAFSNTGSSDPVATNDNQSSELAKVIESDVPLDNIATPQDMVDDNITTSLDINDDSIYASSSPTGVTIDTPHDLNDGNEPMGEDIEDGDAISHGMDAHETETPVMDTDDTAVQDMESLNALATNDVDVATPEHAISHSPTTGDDEEVIPTTQGIQDMEDQGPISHVIDDNETIALNEHAHDNDYSLASADHMVLTVNEGGTENDEQNADQEEPIGMSTGGQNPGQLEQGDGDSTAGAGTVESRTDQETVTENDEMNQQEKDESMEKDVDDVGLSQGSLALLATAQTTTDDHQLDNGDDAKNVESAAADHDEYGETEMYDSNDTYLDEHFDVEEQPENTNDSALSDDQNSVDIQVDDKGNQAVLDQHDNVRNEGNDDDTALLDQNTESLIVDANNIQQDSDLIDQSITQVDTQEFYNSNQPGSTKLSPRTPLATISDTVELEQLQQDGIATELHTTNFTGGNVEDDEPMLDRQDSNEE